MGKIINSKVSPGNRIVYRVLLDENESIALKNATKNINFFSEEFFSEDARIIERGNKGVTKFFEIPFSLRFRKKKEYENLYYQKLETATKIFYIYVIKKKLL